MKSSVVIGFLVAAVASGCASGPRTKVVERADDLKERPSWASTTRSTYSNDGKTFFVGYISVPGDSSPSAAFNMSDEKALSEPGRSMVSDFFDQNSVGEDLRASTGSRVMSSVRKARPPMPSLQVTGRYWERVQIIESEGSERSELRVYSLAEVPTGEFSSAKQEMLRKLRGDPEIKGILSEITKKQRDNAFGSDSPQASGNVQPSSQEQ